LFCVKTSPNQAILTIKNLLLNHQFGSKNLKPLELGSRKAVIANLQAQLRFKLGNLRCYTPTLVFKNNFLFNFRYDNRHLAKLKNQLFRTHLKQIAAISTSNFCNKLIKINFGLSKIKALPFFDKKIARKSRLHYNN